MSSPKPSRLCIFLGVALLISVLVLQASAVTPTGEYEVYCDGVGIFLDKVDGVSASGKPVLFYKVPFPPGTVGYLIGQGRWNEAFVLPEGCVPDGKCETVAYGKIWIDRWDAEDTEYALPKRLSGKYEIDLNGKHLESNFIAKTSTRKHAERLCM